MERMAGLGLGVDLPDGWDGRIYRRQNEAEGGERRALHAANFALPANRGDYGGGVWEDMGRDGVFVTLVEFHADNRNEGLFRREGLPVVIADAFTPDAMPRALPGQAGAQFFFTIGDRAFSLFAVIGSWADRQALAAQVNALIRTISID